MRSPIEEERVTATTTGDDRTAGMRKKSMR